MSYASGAAPRAYSPAAQQESPGSKAAPLTRPPYEGDMSPVIIQSGDMSITADSKLPGMPATPTRLKKRLGRQLRKLREHAGVTLRQAALELRTTDSSVSK